MAANKPKLTVLTPEMAQRVAEVLESLDGGISFRALGLNQIPEWNAFLTSIKRPYARGWMRTVVGKLARRGHPRNLAEARSDTTWFYPQNLCKGSLDFVKRVFGHK